MRILIPVCWGFIVLSLAGCRRTTPENHLANEPSPYLQLHARNPVDWYPWGEEALAKAKRENKLLVISIGYTACHWCHVMEKETFSDTAVARQMNAHFVSIKVDREERPDLDDVYLTACQLTNGGGCGWPLNVFALPDGRPIWAGTYYPRKNWQEILTYFQETYEKEPNQLVNYAARLAQGLQLATTKSLPGKEVPKLPEALLGTAIDQLLSTADEQWGGRQGAPKFPLPGLAQFLLQYSFGDKDSVALKAVTTQLDAMANGGIYDQLGGGFARYTVDEKWAIPHFEKMLYDNAQLLGLYAQAYRATNKPRYRQIMEAIMTFLETSLQHPDGLFYASLDADSEGEEGRYYTWTTSEIKQALGQDDSVQKHFQNYFQLVTLDSDRQVLTRKAGSGDPPDYVRQKLLAARSKRSPPPRDEKLITSWNALAIQGYCEAYRSLGKESLRQKALQMGQFLATRLMSPEGQLWRTYPNGQRRINGFLDDYAHTTQAFIALYQISFDAQWLRRAQLLADYSLAHFADEKSSLLFTTSDLDPQLLIRPKETEDNVIPSANAVLAQAFWELGTLLYRKDYLERSHNMLTEVLGQSSFRQDPTYFSHWLGLYLKETIPVHEVAIVGPQWDARRRELQATYRPHALFLGGATEGKLALLEHKLQEGQTLIYVCKNKACRLPVETAKEALTQF
ncbi:MAG: thioredoxin domain-containing protein [Lewinellaceae bacterium]|nr:thioredoxin domain-containing protein [Lewinellaceae bacterium]